MSDEEKTPYDFLKEFTLNNADDTWKPFSQLLVVLLEDYTDQLDGSWQNTRDRETIIRQQSEKESYQKLLFVLDNLLNPPPETEEEPETDTSESA